MRRLAWAAGALLLTLGAVLALSVLGSSSQASITHRLAPRPHRHHGPPPLSASAVVLPGSPQLTVPRSFLGLSAEYWALPVFERQLPLFERVLSLIHVRDNGPLQLRVGGDSADYSFWSPRPQSLSDWMYAVTPSWLHQTSLLVQQTGMRLLLDLNLVTASPASAGQWARAAVDHLPQGSIAGFEVGNEPDIYSRDFWRAMITPGGASPEQTSQLPRELTPASYARDFRSYAQVLSRTAPHVPLLGPAIANPRTGSGFLGALIGGAGRSLSLATVHRYPYSSCVHPGSTEFPSVNRLLSTRATAGMAHMVTPDVALAHRHALPLRLTELNSVTCGGRAGVSDSFATALWAPDALFSLLRAGVSGVNLHVRHNAINAPFSLGHYGLNARPLLYGLILFARTLGSDPRLMRIRVQAGGRTRLGAWAVRSGDGALNVLALNKGGSPVRLSLRLPSDSPATVERLTAPNAYARSGVTLDRQRLDRRGRWIGRRVLGTVSPRNGTYQVTLPRVSAALIHTSPSVPPRGKPLLRSTRCGHATRSTISSSRC